jgi:hypothetical protein
MIYIGNFLFVTNQQTSAPESMRRHGGFNLVINSSDEDKAIELFKERIRQYRSSSSFFEGNCNIYLVQMIELDEFPQDQAVMLNYKSFGGDPLLPYIECAAPMSNNKTCTIHEWQDNRPITEGKPNERFLSFEDGAT